MPCLPKYGLCVSVRESVQYLKLSLSEVTLGQKPWQCATYGAGRDREKLAIVCPVTELGHQVSPVSSFREDNKEGWNRCPPQRQAASPVLGPPFEGKRNQPWIRALQILKNPLFRGLKAVGVISRPCLSLCFM